MSFQNPLPSCFSRADGGITNPNGTFTPTGTIANGGGVSINHAGNGLGGSIFEEYSDSPEIELAEQATITHRYNCDYNTGQSLLQTYTRGTILQDSYGNLTKILSCKLQQISKTGAILCNFTVVSEGISFSNPPDDFSVQNVELNPALEKHPRYAALTYKDRFIVRNANIVDEIDLATQYTNAIAAITDSNEKQQAQELLFKRHKGEDSFYLSGYKVTWSQYFWLPQIINPGGYIEDPVGGGGLPAMFWSTTGDVGGQSIFSYTTVANPNMFPNPVTSYPYGLSWLRQTDTQEWVRTWYKLTRTWIGAPLGVWDKELYTSTPQPYQTMEDQGAINV